MELFADYHTHSRFSHGKGTVEENVLAAWAKGLKEVAITDHGPAAAPWVGTPLKLLRRLRLETDRCNRLYPDIIALSGAEANLVSADGDIDVPRSAYLELDLLLVGLHPQVIPKSLDDGWTLFGQNLLGRWSRRLRRKARVENTKAMVEAVYRHPIDIVTHAGHKIDIDTAELARACADRGTALEINASHGCLTPEYCRLAAQQGVNFVINSDAHRPEDVGRFEAGIAVAEQAGLPPERIVNAAVGKR